MGSVVSGIGNVIKKVAPIGLSTLPIAGPMLAMSMLSKPSAPEAPAAPPPPTDSFQTAPTSTPISIPPGTETYGSGIAAPPTNVNALLASVDPNAADPFANMPATPPVDPFANTEGMNEVAPTATTA